MLEGPIATRFFFLEDERTKEPAVVFRMWRPYQPEGAYPRCLYELTSGRDTIKGEVTGVDAFDCIINCLSQAGSKIAGLNESVYGGRLSWEASPGGGRGLGLPTIEDAWPFAEPYQEALRNLELDKPPDDR